MEASAVPRPEEISSRITELAREVMEGISQLNTRNMVEENINSVLHDVPQEREVTCPICFEQFEDAHAPRTLRCGHTVCTPCLETILARGAGDRNCPECRRPLKVTAVAHIPVSYTILRLARALEKTCAAAAAGGGPPLPPLDHINELVKEILEENKIFMGIVGIDNIGNEKSSTLDAQEPSIELSGHGGAETPTVIVVGASSKVPDPALATQEPFEVAAEDGAAAAREKVACLANCEAALARAKMAAAEEEEEAARANGKAACAWEETAQYMTATLEDAARVCQAGETAERAREAAERAREVAERAREAAFKEQVETMRLEQVLLKQKIQNERKK